MVWNPEIPLLGLFLLSIPWELESESLQIGIEAPQQTYAWRSWLPRGGRFFRPTMWLSCGVRNWVSCDGGRIGETCFCIFCWNVHRFFTCLTVLWGLGVLKDGCFNQCFSDFNRYSGTMWNSLFRLYPSQEVANMTELFSKWSISDSSSLGCRHLKHVHFHEGPSFESVSFPWAGQSCERIWTSRSLRWSKACWNVQVEGEAQTVLMTNDNQSIDIWLWLNMIDFKIDGGEKTWPNPLPFLA